MASHLSSASVKNDRPVPISPDKTVNVYVLLGLVCCWKSEGAFQHALSHPLPYQVITWFLIIDIMILTYLNNRGKIVVQLFAIPRFANCWCVARCSDRSYGLPRKREVANRSPIRPLPGELVVAG